MTTELHSTNVKFHLETKLHLRAKLQIEVEVHSNSKISVHERNVDLPDREVHSDFVVDRHIEERREKP